jgi:hypothetical protein
MTVHLVKYDEALSLLQALVQREGEDFVYRSPFDTPDQPNNTCVYVAPITQEPSCGLGKVFAQDLGVSINTLIAADQGQDILNQLAGDDVHLTKHASELLFAFQRNQDNWMRYGDALRQACERVPEDLEIDDTHSLRPAYEEVEA